MLAQQAAVCDVSRLLLWSSQLQCATICCTIDAKAAEHSMNEPFKKGSNFLLRSKTMIHHPTPTCTMFWMASRLEPWNIRLPRKPRPSGATDIPGIGHTQTDHRALGEPRNQQLPALLMPSQKGGAVALQASPTAQQLRWQPVPL